VFQQRGAGAKRRRDLERWFRRRGRDFSWRRDPRPWPTFVAEMLLRRTRASQVAEVLPSILDRFPTPREMANAPDNEIRETLRPLGLAWRADGLAESARMIEDKYDGTLPHSLEQLMALPGVGPYVASATLGRISESPVMLIDTNTVRVARRVAGLPTKKDPRRDKETVEAVRELLGGLARAEDWWAVLDLAAQACRPRRPDCPNCPIRIRCATGMGFSGPP
jgi:A/G-specific adenine glycosylase